MRNGFIVDYGTVAARLARDGDEDQAEFLRVFCHELRSCCETDYNAEMQLAAVNARLGNDDRRLLAMLGFQDSEEA